MTRRTAGTMTVRWWDRDVDFPGFWRTYPAILLASGLLAVLLAVLVHPILGLSGVALLLGAFMALWGPKGLLRPTREVRRAMTQGGAVMVGVSALTLLFAGMSGVL